MTDVPVSVTSATALSDVCLRRIAISSAKHTQTLSHMHAQIRRPSTDIHRDTHKHRYTHRHCHTRTHRHTDTHTETLSTQTLTLNKAAVLAQNRPRWRLMSTYGTIYALLVLHARTEDEEESIHHPHHPQLPSFAPASSRPFSQKLFTNVPILQREE